MNRSRPRATRRIPGNRPGRTGDRARRWPPPRPHWRRPCCVRPPGCRDGATARRPRRRSASARSTAQVAGRRPVRPVRRGAARPAPRCGRAPAAWPFPARARWPARSPIRPAHWPDHPRRHGPPKPSPGSRAGCRAGCPDWRAPRSAAVRRRATRSNCARPPLPPRYAPAPGPPPGPHCAPPLLRPSGADGRTDRVPRWRRTPRGNSEPDCAVRQRPHWLATGCARSGRPASPRAIGPAPFRPARHATRPGAPGRCGCRGCGTGPGRSGGPAGGPATASTSRAAAGPWKTAPAPGWRGPRARPAASGNQARPRNPRWPGPPPARRGCGAGAWGEWMIGS
ncbi:hypothetical protein ACMA110817_31405 [Achromobacter marplatensis]